MTANLQNWLEIILLGAVEGITEFLPVSSTGHLIVAAHLLGRTEETDKLFEVVIQLGAVFAVCWHYRGRLWRAAQNPGGEKTLRLATNLILAFLPAAVFGLLFYSYIKEYLFSPQTVAAALIVGGIAILLIEKKNRIPRVSDIDELRTRDAIVIGCCQALALFPGVSRAAATILGAIVWGVERRAATEFSFLLALPTMFAAGGYDLYKNAALLNWNVAGEIAAGFVVSFICALFVIRLLIRYVSRHDFTPFGWYRIIFGIAVLAVF